jgi:phospholipid/cholesterol/gamma-HCH transport system permease protein
MHMKDIVDSLIKAEVFGIVVITICCHIGLNTRGGPREIGASLTKAIVTSLIFILVLDFFINDILI